MRNRERFRALTVALAIAASMLLMSVAGVAAASENATGPIRLSIADAVRIAQEKSPMAAAARGDAKAASARVKMAAAQRKPSLSATSFFSDGDMSGVLSGPSTVMPTALSSIQSQRFYDQNLMLMLPLDASGRISRTIRGAGRRADAAAADAEKTRRDTVLETRMAYYDALYSDSMATAYDNAVKTAEEQLKNDAAMVDAGKAPSYYLDRDRAELAMNEQMRNEGRKEAAAARIRLAAIMGLDPDMRLELTDELAPPTLETPGAPDPKAPETEAAKARSDAAVETFNASRRAFLPDVALTLMANRTDSRMGGVMNGTTAAIVVAVPLLDGGMRRGSRSETNAMREAAAQDSRAVELRLRSDFMLARLEFDTAMKNIESADAQLKSAEENHRVAKIRYEAGKGILVEMLDASSSLTKARLNRAGAVRDALVARDTLLRLAGKL